jgi:hypothetical protein
MRTGWPEFVFAARRTARVGVRAAVVAAGVSIRVAAAAGVVWLVLWAVSSTRPTHAEVHEALAELPLFLGVVGVGLFVCVPVGVVAGALAGLRVLRWWDGR